MRFIQKCMLSEHYKWQEPSYKKTVAKVQTRGSNSIQIFCIFRFHWNSHNFAMKWWILSWVSMWWNNRMKKSEHKKTQPRIQSQTPVRTKKWAYYFEVWNRIQPNYCRHLIINLNKRCCFFFGESLLWWDETNFSKLLQR